MISVEFNQNQLDEVVREEIKKKMSEIDYCHTFWDTKELKRRTCMSWGTIQDTFFHDEDFPKMKIGGKWYFLAKETENFLISWLRKQAQ